MDSKRKCQEDEYDYPYHYISLFIPHRHIHYEQISNFILNKLVKYNFNSIVDVGCGDGFLIYRIKHVNDDIDGYDLSTKALNFAKKFNPNIKFYTKDISKSPLEKKYEAIILQDVIEHIDPNTLKKSIKNISNSLKENGRIFLTVPTKNQKIPEKHYVHYDINEIKNIFPYFKIEYLTFLQQKSRIKNLFFILLFALSQITYIFKRKVKILAPIYSKVSKLTQNYFKQNLFYANSKNGLLLFSILKKYN